jgi:protein gp37
VPDHPFTTGFDLTLRPERLDQPLKWSRPRMIFVNSMSDLFHEAIPSRFISRVATTMCLAHWHTYQVLTKRSTRLQEMLSGPLKIAAREAHIWWGVSVEDRKYGLPRIADLRASPAAVRFLSIEPLLEDLGKLPLEGISWVIVGGESGPGARPMKEAWVLSIREQCEAMKVPFFFKQWGGVRKKSMGRTLLGRTYDEFPRRVQRPPLSAHLRQRYALKIQSETLIQIETHRFIE